MGREARGEKWEVRWGVHRERLPSLCTAILVRAVPRAPPAPAACRCLRQLFSQVVKLKIRDNAAGFCQGKVLAKEKSEKKSAKIREADCDEKIMKADRTLVFPRLRTLLLGLFRREGKETHQTS
jgi:hypothetical protein